MPLTDILSFSSDWFKPNTPPTDVDRETVDGEEQIEMLEKGKKVFTKYYLNFTH